MSEKNEKDPEWKQGTFSGANARFNRLAELFAQTARIGIEQKLADMKHIVNAEARRINHPVADEFAKRINDIKLS